MREDGKQRKYCMFFHESIRNNMSCRCFYGFVDRVDDFWVTILPKKLVWIRKENAMQF